MTRSIGRRGNRHRSRVAHGASLGTHQQIAGRWEVLAKNRAWNVERTPRHLKLGGSPSRATRSASPAVAFARAPPSILKSLEIPCQHAKVAGRQTSCPKGAIPRNAALKMRVLREARLVPMCPLARRGSHRCSRPPSASAGGQNRLPAARGSWSACFAGIRRSSRGGRGEELRLERLVGTSNCAALAQWQEVRVAAVTCERPGSSSRTRSPTSTKARGVQPLEDASFNQGTGRPGVRVTTCPKGDALGRPLVRAATRACMSSRQARRSWGRGWPAIGAPGR